MASFSVPNLSFTEGWKSIFTFSTSFGKIYIVLQNISLAVQLKVVL